MNNDQATMALSRARPHRGALAFLDTVFWLVLSCWFGGLFTLGALVAAIVFRRVPAPYSADAMTEVFRRFDRIALFFAATLLLVEAGRYVLSPRYFFLPEASPKSAPAPSLALPRAARFAHIARIAALVVASACRAIMGFFVSPEIEALHRKGALRGLGEDGNALETFHKMAERLARVEFAFLLVAAIAMVLSVRLASNDDR